MRVSSSWLKELVNIDDTTLNIANKMLFVGNEYESINKISPCTNLVVGHVLERTNHPDSDHLNVCKVDLGDGIYQIVCGAPNVDAGQKVIVAREFSHDPKVLLAAQPTRGIDIGATEFIHQQLLKMRDEGKAILLISSELSEVKGLTDRIIVMHNGQIVGAFKSDEVEFNELGLYMSGAKKMEVIPE